MQNRTMTAGRDVGDYDIFISHNRADKEWVRTLADRLAQQTYNGRALRPWLDERFLDPGDLASDAELTTALDRSRFLGLVLSPEAMTSKWVEFELDYFLQRRESEAVILMLRRRCTLPPLLRELPILDFTREAVDEEQFQLLITTLCLPTEVTVEDAGRAVDEAFTVLRASDPGGFSPSPTAERDNFFRVLMQYDIDNAASEGLAVAAFKRAAHHLLSVEASASDLSYNYKMLLGECLAAALQRSVGYRQVSQQFLDIAERQSDGQSLLFVVARAYSKLGEISSDSVDLSVLFRLVHQLDRNLHVSNEEKALRGLLARTLGKIRATPLGMLLIKILSEGGASSRIVAAGAIALSYKRSEPVFYLSELERSYGNRVDEQETLLEPPSPALLALLLGLDLNQDKAVQSAVQLARQDLQRDFPDIDFPYGWLWLTTRKGEPPSHLHNAPFTGIVAKGTLHNMVDVAYSLGVANIACLTEPRIVDSLFDNCGALLILEQDPDSFQCRRLRDRGVPFGMLTGERMSELSDGNQVVVTEDDFIVQRKPPS